MRLIALLVALMVGNYVYYVWPVIERPDAAYVGQGFESALLYLAFLALILSVTRTAKTRFIASFLCLWGAIEGIQRSLCGLAQWGVNTGGVDLCRATNGPDVYPALAAVSMAVAITLYGVRRG